MKLDFLIIGGVRCGTTWLASMLRHHPQIFVPVQKELGFFNAEYHRGIQFYTDFFKEAKPGQYSGEGTPTYLYNHQCRDRIYSHFPQLKLIVMLRNPIERAYSAFWFFRNLYGGMNFEQAIQYDNELLKWGEYAQYIGHWQKTFGKEQFHMILFDDLKASQKNIIRGVFSFLSVDPGIAPLLSSSTVNPAIFPRLQSKFSKLGLSWIVDLVKRTPLDRVIRQLYTSMGFGRYPSMKPETHGLLRNHFLPYNKRLEQFVERDLSSWNQPLSRT